jgi:putative peptide zinc metalloprotease protein
MFARIKPTLKSLSPREETPDEVTVLKPWVRVAVTLYVFTVVPLLVFLLGLTLINMPRIVATAWDSFLLQEHKLGRESTLATVVTVIQMIVLALPIVGLAYTFWKMGWAVVSGAWARTAEHPLRRGALALATAAVAGVIVYNWLPNGEYRPIQAGERGTLQGGVAELASVRTGRASLTQSRSQQLQGAPSKASQPAPSAPKPAQVPSSHPTGTTSTPTATTSTPTTTSTSTSPAQTTPAAAPAQTTSTPAATTTTDTTATTTTTDTTTTAPATTTTPLP